MSGDAQTALHDAVLVKLTAACTPTPVLDYVPQTEPNARAFPYLVIGENEAEDWDTDTELGQEHRLTIHIFSRARGKQECRDLLKKIYGALHDQNLALAGQQLVLLRYEFSGITPDPDGITQHGVARYRALTTEA